MVPYKNNVIWKWYLIEMVPCRKGTIYKFNVFILLNNLDPTKLPFGSNWPWYHIENITNGNNSLWKGTIHKFLGGAPTSICDFVRPSVRPFVRPKFCSSQNLSIPFYVTNQVVGQIHLGTNIFWDEHILGRLWFGTIMIWDEHIFGTNIFWDEHIWDEHI